ncbi:hypothetical protein EUX98_g776 [Antrodiella citrinella]|uniref:Spindle pole body component n=1 Tax=Antrodiella citrinella TaxID=2447956 RepID=A0A4S4N621_9APHY|nr:hypothetical protein EUX98_g776 [Antrodiella citrinella]
MIAEVLLVLAGHSSSLFPTDHRVHPDFVTLLHPGEQQCLESLGHIAVRYRKIKKSCATLARSQSRYISAFCARLIAILKDEYESLVVDTEAKILKRDSSLVATGSFVPLSSIRAIFAEWDAPLAALEALVDELEAEQQWQPGPLIDLLMARSNTGVHRIASILARLCEAVQRVWITQLQSYLIHGTLANVDPLATKEYTLVDGSMPKCVSAQSMESIAYVGRAIGTDQYEFDRIVGEIRTTVSEWLWLNVLTPQDVEEAVDSLANYFLIRNGEFALSLIRELERLTISRLTGRSGPTTMIREQDLHLALLRSSLGTTAQHDPSLSHLRFHLPSGPLRPLLPSLAHAGTSRDISTSISGVHTTSFDDLLLGTPLVLNYTVSWPLDLFLHTSDLNIYAALFAYLSALRKTHTRIHTCWSGLSNAQRARRRWTGLGEGGTVEDLVVRQELLRCGWGVVRDMTWFLDTLLGYVMTDVVDAEFRRMKGVLLGKTAQLVRQVTGTQSNPDIPSGAPLPPSHSSSTLPTSQSAASALSGASAPVHLDFSTLRGIHTSYLERLLTEVCERFAAQVERWGGDVLPALLFEGSIAGGGDRVGEMVAERGAVVAEIHETFDTLLETFYEQLSQSTTQQPFSVTDASKSVLYNMSTASATSGFHTFIRPKRKRLEGDEEVRRHIERLLLRLDFNGEFSKQRIGRKTRADEDILKQGGLV